MAEVNDRRGRRGLWEVVIILPLTLVLALAAIAPGYAEQRPLEFSDDGVHWTAAPPTALFGDDVVLVPGSSATAALHLRNIASSPGTLDVSLTNVQISTEEAGQAFGLATLTDAGTGVEGAVIGLPRTRFSDLTNATPIGPPVTLDPGQSARFLLTIDLESLPDGAHAQSTAISLDVAITFRDATTTEGSGSEPGHTAPTVVLPVVAADPTQVPAPATERLTTSKATGSDSAGFLALTGFTRTVFLVAATGMVTVGFLLLLAARWKERR